MCGVEAANDKLELINNLIISCIDRHAPLKKVKVTRPPAPWLKELDIANLQQQCKKARFLAHSTHSKEDWDLFRDIRNKLKRKIKYTKQMFYKNALNSKRPKEVWKFIHRILNPNKKPINIDPDTLNNHYLTTAERITNSTDTSVDELYNLVTDFKLDQQTQDSLKFRKVTYEEVIKEIKALRN